MTGTDVITSRARYILTDVFADGNASQRWTDAILLSWLNDGMRVVADYKPDALLTAPYTQAAYADAATIGATLVLPDRYRDSMVDYVVSRALAQDSQNKEDLKKSTTHFQQFVIKAGLPQTLGTAGRTA